MITDDVALIGAQLHGITFYIDGKYSEEELKKIIDVLESSSPVAAPFLQAAIISLMKHTLYMKDVQKE